MSEPMTLRDAERMAKDLGLSTSEKDMTGFITYHSLYVELAGDTGHACFYAQPVEPLRSFRTLLEPHFPGAKMVLNRSHMEMTVVE